MTFNVDSLTNSAADAIVIAGRGDNMKLLLVERKYSPFQGAYAFPGGFIDEGEHPLDACVRELEEETALVLDKNTAIELSVRNKDDRDPRKKVVGHPYLFFLEEEVEVTAQDDARAALWVKLIDIHELAFDHGAILCEALGKFWPNMPSFAPKLSGIELPQLLSNKISDKNVYYGGSFNPWHDGHTECLKQCKEYQESFHIVVVPDVNPWKKGREGSVRCFYRSFLEICRTIMPFEFSVYSGFWGAEFENPTSSWLLKVEDKNKAMLIGDDNFLSFHKWQNSQKLLDELDALFVVPRELSFDDLNEKKSVHKELSSKIFILDDHEYQHLSSTEIRGK